MRFFSFSLLISGGAVLGHLYIYRRLLKPLITSRKYLWALAGVLGVMTVLLLLRGPIRRIDPDVKLTYEVVSYTWMACALCLVGAAAVGDGLGLLHAFGRHGLAQMRRFGQPPTPAADTPDASRRRVTRALPLAMLAGGSATAGYGIMRAFTPAEVSEVPVHLPRLPRSLDGLSIAQLTDVHVGPFIRRAFMDRLVEQTNDLRPDVVVITGDLVDGDVSALGDAVSALANLRTRYGAFFVTGNHEYYSGVGPWVRFLGGIGVEVLRNRHVSIGDEGGRFDLVGVDDWSGARRAGGQGYDLDLALRGRDPARAAVLLSHQPKNFEQAARRGIGLQISGHTHGGQLFPMTMLVGLGYDYYRGLYPHGESHIYVSRGCGFWGPPARVGSAPEIVKFTLLS